eukprot:2271620-Amphidinium_carterae.1
MCITTGLTAQGRRLSLSQKAQPQHPSAREVVLVTLTGGIGELQRSWELLGLSCAATLVVGADAMSK